MFRAHQGGPTEALATTGAKRSTANPDVPTVAESGLPGYEAISWQGLVAPAKTDKAIVERLDSALRKAAGSKKLAEKVAENGMELRISSPEELRDVIVTEQKKSSAIIKRTGAKVE